MDNFSLFDSDHDSYGIDDGSFDSFKYDDEDEFDSDILELAEQLGISPEEAQAYSDFLDNEKQKDSDFKDFLSENGFEGVDLDSGEFF